MQQQEISYTYVEMNSNFSLSVNFVFWFVLLIYSVHLSCMFFLFAQVIVQYPPTKPLSSEEGDLIWKFRFYLSNQKKVKYIYLILAMLLYISVCEQLKCQLFTNGLNEIFYFKNDLLMLISPNN